MTLDGLAPELLNEIARCLWLGDMSHLAQTNRRLHKVLTPFLYHTDALPYNRHALFWAVANGSLPVLELALQGGTPVDPGLKSMLSFRPFAGAEELAAARSGGGLDQEEERRWWTPLDLAAGNGHVGVLRRLLGPVQPNEEVVDRFVIRAATEGDTEMLRLMLQHAREAGFDVGAMLGMAVMAAAEHGRREMVELLLENTEGAAALDVTSDRYELATIAAVRGGHADIWDLLTARQPLTKAPTRTVCDILNGAWILKEGDEPERAASELLDQLVELETERGNPELLMAEVCMGKRIAFAKRLVSLMGPNLPPTIACMLCVTDSPEMIELVLCHMADVDSDDDIWRNTLDAVLQGGCPNAAKAIVARAGTPPLELMDPKDQMFRACSRAKLNTVKLLLSWGVPADKTYEVPPGGTMPEERQYRTPPEYTPLEAAMDVYGDPKDVYEIAQVLLEAGADPDNHPEDRRHGKEPLTRACEVALPSVALLLLERGAAVNQQEALNEALLKACGYCCDVNLVEELLKRGADVNAKTSGGATPLHELCLFRKACRGQDPRPQKNTRYEVAKVLLAHGADPNARNMTGATPLHFACTAADQPSAEDARVVLALLEHGADMEQRNETQKTPLFCACRHLNDKVAAILLACGAAHDNLRGFVEQCDWRRELDYINAGSERGFHLMRRLLAYGVDANMLRRSLLLALDDRQHMVMEDTIHMLLVHGGVDQDTKIVVGAMRGGDVSRMHSLALELGMKSSEEPYGVWHMVVLSMPAKKKAVEREGDEDEEIFYY